MSTAKDNAKAKGVAMVSTPTPKQKSTPTTAVASLKGTPKGSASVPPTTRSPASFFLPFPVSFLLKPGAAVGDQPKKEKRRFLTDNERQLILHLLLKNQKEDGNLRKGSFLNVSKVFNIHPRTCTRIWKRFLETRCADAPAGDVSSRKCNAGRKKKPLSDLDCIKEIPHEKRTDLRTLSKMTGIPLTTLWRRRKEGSINKQDGAYQVI